MHPFFCDRARVTCHPRLPWPSQITAFSFTCCPFPLTGYFFDLLNWGMPVLKLWMYIDTADHHQNGYACTLSILADVNFGSFAHKHLGWLPVTLCRYDLPLTLCTQPLSPYRLFWYRAPFWSKQSLFCSWLAFLLLEKSTWPAVFTINLTGCCSKLSKNDYAHTLNILASADFWPFYYKDICQRHVAPQGCNLPLRHCTDCFDTERLLPLTLNTRSFAHSALWIVLM